MNIHDFSCFFMIAFFGGSGAHFFRFWSVLGTSQIDPDPSKVEVLLRPEHHFQKIMFFSIKNRGSKKTQKNDAKKHPEIIQKVICWYLQVPSVLDFGCCLILGSFLGPSWRPSGSFWPPFGVKLQPQID